MVLRIITGICGIAIIIMAIRTKLDKTGKYSANLKGQYTEQSIKNYIEGTVYSELFFGFGLAGQGIFGEGIGYWICSGICLMGIVILVVYMRKLKKKNIPYRNSDKKR